jgi:membrane-bound serine protease (ClpP class)
MLTIVAIALALLVLPSPWGWVAVVGAATIDVLETLFFMRWSTRRRSAVGVDTLVGRRAVVVTALAPQGNVRLNGELWRADSPVPIEPGQEVVVRAVNGLVLEVERTDAPG